MPIHALASFDASNPSPAAELEPARYSLTCAALAASTLRMHEFVTTSVIRSAYDLASEALRIAEGIREKEPTLLHEVQRVIVDCMLLQAQDGMRKAAIPMADQGGEAGAQKMMGLYVAENTLQQTLHLLKDMATACTTDAGDHSTEADTYLQMAIVYRKLAEIKDGVANITGCEDMLKKVLELARTNGLRTYELRALSELANMHEHCGMNDPRQDRQAAAFYRQMVFYILATRYSKATPSRCLLTGDFIKVLEPTTPSTKLCDEITIVPTCLHVFRTRALLMWQQTPSKRRSWLSPERYNTLRQAAPCPVCELSNRLST
mmetsp:Transcript_41356/g.77481  ORF Transcript_41356/g.77481 Transcript_41356/m.77481 type:complete len:319 (-) Transcript_41356:151-1107(-)